MDAYYYERAESIVSDYIYTREGLDRDKCYVCVYTIYKKITPRLYFYMFTDDFGKLYDVTYDCEKMKWKLYVYDVVDTKAIKEKPEASED